jgi:hypothetical protein
MLTWAGGPMIDFVTRRPQEFISAVEAPADGVTLLVHLTGVPPLHLRAAHEPAEPSQTAPPGATVEIVPGFRGA